MNTVGKERGWSPIGRAEFDAMRGPQGALVVGSPQEVADKILREHEIFGNQRFLLQMSIGAMPHREVLRAIELFGTAGGASSPEGHGRFRACVRPCLGVYNSSPGQSASAERYRSGRNGRASKACCRVTGTWVRIPPSPPTITSLSATRYLT